MIIPSFDLSLVFGIVLFTGIFLILSLCVAVWASVLFYLFGKIPQKGLQMILPVVVALVFIAGEIPFKAFLYTILGENEFLMSGPYMSVFSVIPFATILAMGVIAPFPLIREHLTLKRPWYAIFAASTVVGTYIFLHNFIVAFGPHQETSRNLSWTPYFQSVTLFSQFLEAIVIAAAVFGVIVFLQYANRMLAGNRLRRGILALVAIILIVLLPATGIGGFALFLWLVMQKIPGRINPVVISVAAVLLLALTGTMLSGISGMGTVVDYAVITMAIMAFAVLVPFLYLAPGIERNWQPVILFTGAVAADIVLTLVATVFELGEWLTSDPITIVTFAEGGIIFAACAYTAGQYLITHQKYPSPPAEGGEVP